MSYRRLPGPATPSVRRDAANSRELHSILSSRAGFYYQKKKYMALLVAGGYSVLQADTDTVWTHDPFRMLRLMRDTSIVCMRDVGLANAGVMYARPGSQAALRLLEEVAWRVQLFQLHPEIVGRIVPFSRPPFYANSDDQTLLNDAILSAVIRNRTFLGSTARYEARNKYNPKAPEWNTQGESKQLQMQMRKLWQSQRAGNVVCPWDQSGGAGGAPRKRYRYIVLPIGEDDAVALAPRILFAHLPFAPQSAITHLTAARGFGAKVAALRRIGKWYPLGSQDDIPTPEGTNADEEAQLLAQLPHLARGTGGKSLGSRFGVGGRGGGKSGGGRARGGRGGSGSKGGGAKGSGAFAAGRVPPLDASSIDAAPANAAPGTTSQPGDDPALGAAPDSVAQAK